MISKKNAENCHPPPDQKAVTDLTDMRIIDTYPNIPTAFANGAFSPDRWRAYIDAAIPGLRPLLEADAQEIQATGGVAWERDFLPVLNALPEKADSCRAAHDSFLGVTDGLDRTIRDKFGRSVDVDVYFYLGLCNGAGWVTSLHGRTVVLLGLEKIVELNWCGPDDMRGLIWHELGHVYQAQHGVLKRAFDRAADRLLWQLFTEGVAMVFEQRLADDAGYYHQDKNGWKAWCDGHFADMKADFRRDLDTVTCAGQRWFGDWVYYRDHADVGYYLGCRFVRYILTLYPFDDILRFDIGDVRRLYDQFMTQL